MSAKKTWKVLNKKNIDLNYVDHFSYKFIFVTKVNIFKSYVDISHNDKQVWGLQFITLEANVSEIIY